MLLFLRIITYNSSRDVPHHIPKKEDIAMTIKSKLQSFVWIATILFVLLGSVTTGASAKSAAQAGTPLAGGQLLPPPARPHGYSLADAAAATAYFNTGPRTPDTLPKNFPFQILYIPPDNSNTFSVSTGTMLYVPVITSDNRDALYWPFPDVTDPAAVSAYYFDPAQLGAEFMRIVVDGQVRELGSAYAIGVEMPQPRPSEGVYNYTVVAAFLTPLSRGVHTVTIAARLSGAFILQAFGGPYEFEISYTVTVE
jgi:hypothetical protein